MALLHLSIILLGMSLILSAVWQIIGSSFRKGDWNTKSVFAEAPATVTKRKTVKKRK